MTTLTLSAASANAHVISFTVATAEASSAIGPILRHVPLDIPRAQVYYWTPAWQRDEIESLGARDDGDVVRFEDPTDPGDAARWLLSDDE